LLLFLAVVVVVSKAVH
jgi:hypothetical protein